MSPHIEGMVMVATGVPAIVTRWSMVLRNAGVEFAVTRQFAAEETESQGSLDLWVEERRVMSARAAIITAEGR
jgi:hypothetical protein